VSVNPLVLAARLLIAEADGNYQEAMCSGLMFLLHFVLPVCEEQSMDDNKALSGEAQLAILRDYSEGRLGMRQTIESLGFRDYADLLIALAQHGLNLPKPVPTLQHDAHLARARSVLQPLLRHGG
jgi:hypothetical protein